MTTATSTTVPQAKILWVFVDGISFRGHVTGQVMGDK